MSLLRTHLVNHLRKVATFHKILAQHHSRHAEREQDEASAQLHKDLAAAYKDHADSCAAYAENCEKAEDGDLEKALPAGISGVIPSDVPRQGFRAVPRKGQPELSRAQVPDELQHLIKVELE